MVLFGTLKVQSFMLTEVRDCDLLIVVTSSTFLKRKDMLKEKAVSPDHQNPQHSIHIDKCILYTYTVRLAAQHTYRQMYSVHLYGPIVLSNIQMVKVPSDSIFMEHGMNL